MPRTIKTKGKPGGTGTPPAKKNAVKRNKLYDMPEKLEKGTVLSDLSKNQWCIGSSIGIGGFGEIYSACRVGEKTEDYVVKCEPHGNGPLFVEMHFYMRHAKLDDIKRYQKKHNLKSIGMPHMLGCGSTDINGKKHRFIVMKRYGSDLSKHFVANGGQLPEGTIYRLAIQMIDIYEFIHSIGYVHSDLKAANILIGLGKAGASQAYLVDFGLVVHKTTKEFKPDPKKMHNGTIQYTSRDAHSGVPTLRSDFEILGYNLIEWLGVELPWVKAKILTQPVKVQKAKEEFMSDVDKNLKMLFPKGVPVPINEFMHYVSTLEYNEEPNYENCRKIFLNALKIMKISNTGELDFTVKAATSKKLASPIKRKVASKVKPKVLANTSVDIIDSTDDEDFDVQITPKKTVLPDSIKVLPSSTNKSSVSPVKKLSPRVACGATKIKSISPARATKRKITAPINGDSSSSPRKTARSTPLSAKINFNPSISVSSGPRQRHGKTIINDNLTPNTRAGKTYEFNFELDVSMDANVIVNVKRKKKASTLTSTNTGTSSTAHTKDDTDSSNTTPVTRLKVRKVGDDKESVSSSPRTPAVTVKKSRRFISPR